MSSHHGRDREELSLRLPSRPGEDAAGEGRDGAGPTEHVSDHQAGGPRSPASGAGYLDHVYHHTRDSPSHSYHADLYDDDLEHIDMGGRHSRAHSDVMTIEETYMNEDADIDDKDVEGAGEPGRFGETSMRQWEDGVDAQREDPVSRWVEKTFTGEAPAVRTHRGGKDAEGGVILMGVPPVVAPLSKKAMARKTTKIKKLAAQKKWLCVEDTGSTELVCFVFRPWLWLWSR